LISGTSRKSEFFGISFYFRGILEKPTRNIPEEIPLLHRDRFRKSFITMFVVLKRCSGVHLHMDMDEDMNMDMDIDIGIHILTYTKNGSGLIKFVSLLYEEDVLQQKKKFWGNSVPTKFCVYLGPYFVKIRCPIM
jgi:hypothetical protein